MGWNERYIGWTAILGAVVMACGAPQKPAAPVAPPEARVATIFPQPDSLDAAKVVVTIEVNNPGDAPVELVGIDYTLDAGAFAGEIEGTSAPKGVLEPGQRAEVEFNEAVPFPSDPEAYKATLEKGTIPIDLSGKVRFADGRAAEFKRRGAIAAPTLPNLIVHDVQAARYDGGRGIDVTLFLRLLNENSFTVVVDELRYEVAVNGKALKSGKDIGVRLVANAVSEYEESAAIDEKTFGRAGVRAVQAAGKVAYVVSGQIDIRGMELPFNLEGEVKLAGE